MIVQNLRLRVVVLALLLMLGSMPVSARQQTALPSDIDEYAARVLKEFDVPGMAVAVVKDGKVILAKGYGVREIGKPEPVTADTLFGIASNSKAFTTC
jgi:CubicO group peptidase (beta-lactamase class C family)